MSDIASDEKTVSLIVPCLNEEQNVPVLVDKLRAILKHYELDGEILIVDDLSDDYTFKEALILETKFPEVRALHKGMPRGIGNAIKFGINNARGKVGVVVMGDLVDPLHAISDFCVKILEEDHVLVLLSRYTNPSDSDTIPFLYKFYQFWFRLLCRLLIGMNIKDPTYAYRAFSIDYIRSLKLESGGFEISPEVTIKTFLKKGKIGELTGKQGRRISGESKFLFSRQGWGYARMIAKGLIYRFTGKWVVVRKKHFQVEDF